MRALIAVVALATPLACTRSGTAPVGDPRSTARVEAAPWATVSGGPGDALGVTVAAVGDLDGDGFGDLAVGLPGGPGSVAIYRGSATGVQLATSLTGSLDGDRFGAAIAGAGDVDGDGLADVVIGAPGEASGAGAVYVYLGAVEGLSALPALTFAGDAGDALGAAVGPAGDADQDGFADVIVGSSQQGGPGRFLVFHGAATGIASVPDLDAIGATSDEIGRSVWTAGDVNGDGFHDVIVAGATLATWMPGSAAGVVPTGSVDLETGLLNAQVRGGGDVDNDGFDDVIAASDQDTTGPFDGAAVVFAGAAGGPDPAGTQIPAPSSGGAFGSSVVFLGDVNGDGFSDVAIGSPLAMSGAGAVDVFQGGAVGLATPASDRIAGPPGGTLGTSLGGGDLDGDGYDDLIAGAPGALGGAGSVRVHQGYAEDDDRDGLGVDVDCDDNDPAIRGGRAWYPDADADGWGDAGGASTIACNAPAGSIDDRSDCDDGDALVHPGAADLCNGEDDDCDGRIDDGFSLRPYYRDADGDGYGVTSDMVFACAGAGRVLAKGDCDDLDPAVHPAAAEVCDGIDQDCDGAPDNGYAEAPLWYFDGDGDGHGVPTQWIHSCGSPSGFSSLGDDCDDADPAIHGGGVDLPYDGIDQDCEGGDECDVDDDQHPALVCGGGDCDDEDDARFDGAADAPYDGIDQDCDGDDTCDFDVDGHTESGPSCGGEDCDDRDPATFPGAVERPYDDVDQDCDGADLCDVDGDGFDGMRCGGADCDDDAALSFPGAADVPGDRIDADCDGVDAVEVWGGGSGAVIGCATPPGAPGGVVVLASVAVLLRFQRRTGRGSAPRE